MLPPSSSSNSLPPLAQPQLSLYPHIHNTPPGSDIVGGVSHTRDDVGPVPPPPTTKPPITTNPYVVCYGKKKKNLVYVSVHMLISWLTLFQQY